MAKKMLYSMTDFERNIYKRQSTFIINGIDLLLKTPEKVLNVDGDKRMDIIAEYMGLPSDNALRYIKHLIPTQKNIFIVLIFSKNCEKDELFHNKDEEMGRPHKRYIINYQSDVFTHSCEVYLEAEHHIITYPLKYIKTKADVTIFLKNLKDLFTNGFTEFKVND